MNSLKRLIAKCCGLFSYHVAADNLRELCGISLSYVTFSDLTVADEMKVGVLAKRVNGESALPEDWDKRTLPKPTAVSAFAMIAKGACWWVDRGNKIAIIVAALYTAQPIRQGKIPTKV